MITKNNFLIKLLLASFILSFFGCTKDLYEDNMQMDENKNLKVTHVTINKIKKSIASKINERVALLKKGKINSQGKFEYNEALGIYIDLEEGTLIEYDGKNYFTFPMFKEDEENLENILFVIDDSTEEMETILVKYDIKPEEFAELPIGEINTLTPEYSKIFIEGNSENMCVTLSFYQTTYGNCTWANGYHEDTGVQCDAQTVTLFSTFCTVSDGGTSSGSGSGSGTGTGTGTGTSTGSGYGGGYGSGVYTSPKGLTLQQIAVKSFFRNLSTSQKNCLNSQTPAIRDAISDFVNSAFELGSSCVDNQNTQETALNLVRDLLNNICSGNPEALEDFESWFNNTVEGPEYDSGVHLDDSTLFPPQTLPTFDNFFLAYPLHNDVAFSDSQQVYTAVGGDVLARYNAGARNTCALRLSMGLNGAGIVIPNITGVTVKGADNKNYFLMASDLLKWMKRTFGTPTGSNHLLECQGGVNGVNFKSLLQGKQGIYIMIPNDTTRDGFEASGHAALFWNDNCDGYCYFDATGGVKEIFFWELP